MKQVPSNRAATEASALFDEALVAERVRSAQQIARFRFVAVSATLAINVAFLVFNPGYIGPPLVALTAYWLAAAGLLLLRQRRTPVAAPWSGLALPLVDMPVIFLLIHGTIDRLRMGEFAADAASVATQLPLFYLLLILAASLSLEENRTRMAAAVAIVLQSVMLLSADRHPSFVLMVALATALGTWLALYTRRRSVSLVRTSALEQTRRERLGRYFSPQVAEAVASAQSSIERGERREVTVLFADLRDFTSLSERLTPEQVVAVLDRFHSRMVDCIFAAGGTLDKYLGDGLMAYFGAPVTATDHAERAVRCAMEMQASLAALNVELRGSGLPELRMGIGVHSGSVILGDIGAARRREYTIIGDTVNVASRIEQLTKSCDAPLLVSEETKGRIAAPFAFRAVEPIRVKGKAEPLHTYRVDDGVPLAEG